MSYYAKSYKPPNSALDKKIEGVRLVLLFIENGHRQTPSRNEYEETIPTPLQYVKGYSMGYTRDTYTNRMSVILSLSFYCEIGDFVFRIKAKNAFYKV